MQIPFFGEACCLTAAAMWAVAVTLFRPAIERHGARTINLIKCAVATVLQGLSVFLLGQSAAFRELTWVGFGWIAASAITGLVLGDTALFSAVRSLGVQRTLLLQTVTPGFAALLAWMTLGEIPRPQQAVGGLVILCGIAFVVAPREGKQSRAQTLGVLVALIAALGQASGIVLAKIGMQEIPVLPASTLRLAVATVGLALLAGLSGRIRGTVDTLRGPLMLRRILPATVVGTYLAMFLFMAGVAFAPAAIASVLIGTTPVFSLLIDSITRRRLPDRRSVLGTALAVAGVALLSLG